MDEMSIDGLRAELARLQADQDRLSAERTRLHDRIDFGFGTDETRSREREVSQARQDLHRRIDAVRRRIGSLEVLER